MVYTDENSTYNCSDSAMYAQASHGAVGKITPAFDNDTSSIRCIANTQPWP